MLKFILQLTAKQLSCSCGRSGVQNYRPTAAVYMIQLTGSCAVVAAVTLSVCGAGRFSGCVVCVRVCASVCVIYAISVDLAAIRRPAC